MYQDNICVFFKSIDSAVHKLAYCPQSHVLFVNY